MSRKAETQNSYQPYWEEMPQHMVSKGATIISLHQASRKREKLNGAARPGKPDKRGSGDSFDQWLTQNLHDLYDPILREPLPPEIEALLDAIPDKEKP